MISSTAACLVWNPDPVLLQWGGLTMDWYGVTFGMGLFFAFFLARWQLVRDGMEEARADGLLGYLFLGMVGGAFIGDRLFFQSPAKLLPDLWKLVTFQAKFQGFFSFGAAAGLLLVLWWFRRKHGGGLWRLADALVYSVALLVVCVRLGNLINGEAVGIGAQGVAWAFCFPDYDGGALIPRHPYALYEGMGLLAVMAGLLWADRRMGGKQRPVGMLSALAILGYGGVRFVAEFWREYPMLDLHFIKLTIAQWFSLIFIIIGYSLLQWARGHALEMLGRKPP